MVAQRTPYIHGLTYQWLNRFYDPLLRLTMRESHFKRRLIEQAKIKPGHRVLDVGCGTGTLAIMMKQHQPKAEIIGLDGDPDMLTRARQKTMAAQLPIHFDLGVASSLPYGDDSYDRVVSSLVLHHLTTADKLRAAKEVYRVLRPSGQLHVADFGRPHNAFMLMVSLIIRHFEEVDNNIKGLLPDLFRSAGFTCVEQAGVMMTVAGTLAFYRATKP